VRSSKRQRPAHIDPSDVPQSLQTPERPGPLPLSHDRTKSPRDSHRSLAPACGSSGGCSVTPSQPHSWLDRHETPVRVLGVPVTGQNRSWPCIPTACWPRRLPMPVEPAGAVSHLHAQNLARHPLSKPHQDLQHTRPWQRIERDSSRWLGDELPQEPALQVSGVLTIRPRDSLLRPAMDVAGHHPRA